MRRQQAQAQKQQESKSQQQDGLNSPTKHSPYDSIVDDRHRTDNNKIRVLGDEESLATDVLLALVFSTAGASANDKLNGRAQQPPDSDVENDVTANNDDQESYGVGQNESEKCCFASIGNDNNICSISESHRSSTASIISM